MSFLYFYLLIIVHPYLAMWWKSFPKAGHQAWEALVPGYNYYVVFNMTSKKPWWSLLLVFPGVHLAMWMVANVSYIRRFGYFSFADTQQGIFFPYLIMAKIANTETTFGNETNWSNSREVEIRKWGDHIVLFMCLPVVGHVFALAFDMVSRDKPGEKTRVKEWGDSFLWALVAASVIRTYVFEPFQIPTGSMEKTMLVGDFLFVNKLAYGPKVPVTPLSYPLVHNIVPFVNIKSYTTLEKGTYTRLPGYRKINRNDVVVFNYPSGDTAIVDPRTPNGLMGHDYHGIIIKESQFLFTQSIPEYAKDTKLNIDAVVKRSTLPVEEAEAVALAAAFATGNSDFQTALLIFRANFFQAQSMNDNVPCFTLHLNTCTRIVVQSFAVLFQGAVHGRNLINGARKLSLYLTQLFRCKADRLFCNHFAF